MGTFGAKRAEEMRGRLGLCELVADRLFIPDYLYGYSTLDYPCHPIGGAIVGKDTDILSAHYSSVLKLARKG